MDDVQLNIAVVRGRNTFVSLYGKSICYGALPWVFDELSRNDTKQSIGWKRRERREGGAGQLDRNLYRRTPDPLSRSGDVILPQLRCGSGYETSRALYQRLYILPTPHALPCIYSRSVNIGAASVMHATSTRSHSVHEVHCTPHILPAHEQGPAIKFAYI